MKKSLILLAIIVFITGCNQELKDNKKQQSGEKNIHNSRRPDFGQPERVPDIVGIVKSIVGNEVTILEIEMPNFGKKDNTETNEERRQSPTLGGGTNPTGKGMGRMGMNRSTEDKNNMIEMLKQRSIAESTVVVPVGIQMLKPEIDDETKVITMLEANVSDVKKDQMLSVWINQSIEDRKIAEFVLIK